MDSIAFHSPTVPRFRSFFSFGRKPIFTFKDVHASLNNSKGIRLSVSSIRIDGNGRDPPARRSSEAGRARKNESSRKTNDDAYNKAAEEQNPKSNNQEEIIALFRRIQASIAKENPASTKDEDSNKDELGADSILEALRGSRKRPKGKSSKKAGDRNLRKKEMPKEHQTLPKADFELVRPPSKFVKRSPIPYPSAKVQVLQYKEEAFPARAIASSEEDTEELKISSFDGMKLSELKAIAKSKKIKGYSKLKKNELLQLLRS